MNILKSATLKWYQLGALKWTSLCFGIAVGSTWPELFLEYRVYLLLTAFTLGLYSFVAWFRQSQVGMGSISSAEYRRFFRYSLIGSGTFLFDLLLLYVFIDIFKWHYLAATASAFFIAVSINYSLSRQMIFSTTKRGFLSGYVNFLLIVSIGLGFITGAMYVAVEVMSLNYFVSRVSIAGLTGVWNYLMNLLFNFRLQLLRK